MPSTSAKQAKFMRAIAHSPSFAKKVGVKQSVGKDFEMADKKAKKFGSGGGTKFAPGTNDPDFEDEGVMKSKPKQPPKQQQQPKPTKPAPGNNDLYERIPPKLKPEPRKPLGPMGKKGYAAGGVTKRMPTSEQMGSMNMAKGGGIEKKGKTSTKMVKMVKMAKGGKVDAEAKRELAFMKAKKAPKSMVKAERAEEGMRMGGKLKKFAKGGSIDGIAQRGKTRCAGSHKGMK